MYLIPKQCSLFFICLSFSWSDLAWLGTNQVIPSPSCTFCNIFICMYTTHQVFNKVPTVSHNWDLSFSISYLRHTWEIRFSILRPALRISKSGVKIFSRPSKLILFFWKVWPKGFVNCIYLIFVFNKYVKMFISPTKRMWAVWNMIRICFCQFISIQFHI